MKGAPIHLTSKKMCLFAGTFCIVYILIHCFQQYVFGVTNTPTSLSEELLQGTTAIHKGRAILLLLSFFPMLFVFCVIIFYDFRSHVVMYSLALIGFVVFCFLDIGLRSVEFFYFQQWLPRRYLGSTEPMKKTMIETFSTFQSVQASLYFPLMLSQAISSVILAALFPSKPKMNFLVKIAFAINAFRLIGRIASMLFMVHWFDSFNGMLYLPFVIVTFGLLAWWFLRLKTLST